MINTCHRCGLHPAVIPSDVMFGVEGMRNKSVINTAMLELKPCMSAYLKDEKPTFEITRDSDDIYITYHGNRELLVTMSGRENGFNLDVQTVADRIFEALKSKIRPEKL